MIAFTQLPTATAAPTGSFAATPERLEIMQQSADRSVSITHTGRRPFGRYVLLGMGSMASAEFQGNVLLRGSLVNFVLAMVVVYLPLSAIAYCIGRYVKSQHADLWFYAAGGLFGLLVIEWCCLGFYPGSGKAGIHAAMFTNWAAVFTIPRLFTAQLSERVVGVRRKVQRTVVIYSVGAPLLVLASPISKGGTVALLMSAYSILLSFQFVPFLVESRRGRSVFNSFNIFLIIAAVVNVMFW